jgi:uncharacterized Ntn-hydrolase superfamily protein
VDYRGGEFRYAAARAAVDVGRATEAVAVVADPANWIQEIAMNIPRLTVLLLLIVPVALFAQRQRGVTPDLGDPPGTFSILGYDPRTGEVGGAVASRVFSVGNGVLWAEADAGVVATQAIVDVSYGPQALELLRKGMTPSEIVKTIWERDPDPRPAQPNAEGREQMNWTKHGRQFAVMNAKGDHAVFTGPKASSWAGSRHSTYATAQGNILAGEKVVEAMIAAFDKGATDESGNPRHLSWRLLEAIEAGHAAGGDTRGQESAAMIIVKKGCGVWLNNDVVLRLQVDYNREAAIADFRRLVERWNQVQGRRREGC